MPQYKCHHCGRLTEHVTVSQAARYVQKHRKTIALWRVDAEGEVNKVVGIKIPGMSEGSGETESLAAALPPDDNDPVAILARV